MLPAKRRSAQIAQELSFLRPQVEWVARIQDISRGPEEKVNLVTTGLSCGLEGTASLNLQLSTLSFQPPSLASALLALVLHESSGLPQPCQGH